MHFNQAHFTIDSDSAPSIDVMEMLPAWWPAEGVHEFIDCTFTGVNLPIDNENVYNSIFRRCKFERCVFSCLEGQFPSFNECEFNRCDWSGVQLDVGDARMLFARGHIFRHCNLTNIRIDAEGIDPCYQDSPVWYFSSDNMATLIIEAIVVDSDLTGLVLNEVELDVHPESMSNCFAAHIWVVHGLGWKIPNFSIGLMINLDCIRYEYLERLCQGHNQCEVSHDDSVVNDILTEKFAPFSLPGNDTRPGQLLYLQGFTPAYEGELKDPVDDWYERNAEDEAENEE